MVNGLEVLGMEEVRLLGLMVQNTKVNGIWGELMGMENSFILKVRSMMECGDTIKRMAKGSTFTQMEHSIRVAGKRIFRMD